MYPVSPVFLFLFKTGVVLIPFQSLYLCYLSKFILLFYLICSISAAVILLASLALMVQFPLPYKKAGSSGVFYNFILVFFRVFGGLNTLFIMPVTFKQLFVINVPSTFIGYKISQIYKRLNLFYNCVINYNFTSG